MLARVQRAIFFVLWHDDVKAPWLKLNAAARAESKTEAEQEQPPETRARASTKWRVPSSPSPPRHVFRSRSLYPLHSFPPILTLSLSPSPSLSLSFVFEKNRVWKLVKRTWTWLIIDWVWVNIISSRLFYVRK